MTGFKFWFHHKYVVVYISKGECKSKLYEIIKTTVLTTRFTPACIPTYTLKVNFGSKKLTTCSIKSM